MYLDVKSNTFGELNQIGMEGDEWTELTGHYLFRNEDDAYEGGLRALQLVKDKLVHSPHEVELNGVAFEDERAQYVFREEAVNLLLAKTMGRWARPCYMSTYRSLFTRSIKPNNILYICCPHGTVATSVSHSPQVRVGLFLKEQTR
jgi:hypothetical protein